MWIEELENGKFKYFERYTDPYTEKYKKVSVTLAKNNASFIKEANRLLNIKIKEKLNKKTHNTIKFHELIDKWYDTHQKTIRDSSKPNYEARIKIIKGGFDENLIVSKMDTKLIQKFFDGVDYSNQYTSAIKSMLNLVIEYGRRMEYIDSNPIIDVKLARRVKTISEIEMIESKYFEREELKALLISQRSSKLTYGNAILSEFMSLTGLRIGEAISLKRENYSKADRTIIVTGTLDYTKGYGKGRKGLPKTAKSYRTIPLSDRAVELVDEMLAYNEIRKEHSRYNDRDFIFTTRTGTPIQVNSFNLSLKKTAATINLNKNLSSHIFRHTHTSLLSEMNVPLKAIMDRVGHEDESTTLKIYTHVTKKMRTDIVDKLNHMEDLL